jgi:hypothetical protein
LYRAWPEGVEWITGDRFTLTRYEAGMAAALLLLLVRRARLSWLTVRPGPVEVRPLEDASSHPSGRFGHFTDSAPDAEAQLHRLNVEFREALSGAQLYETTTLPGDLETERIIEVFRGGQGGGRLAMLGAAWAFFWPNRAFIVTATLRTRSQGRRFGVSVSVQRIPFAAIELETHWSGDFERALRRAAFAVTAQIVPMTKASSRPPWGQWRVQSAGKPMPMELMRHYQRAKRMVGERRYDEALSLYHSALLYDADNVHLRYDVGQLFERLQLYPDAVRHYALLTNRLFPFEDETDGTRGRKARISASLHDDPFMIRYRYVGGLSTGSRLAAELLTPDWPVLRDWLERDIRERAGVDQQDPKDRSHRPWRATELADLRRQLTEHFDGTWRATLPPSSALHGVGLKALLVDDPKLDAPPGFLSRLSASTGQASIPLDPAWGQLSAEKARLLAVEEYFLHVAKAEVAFLIEGFVQFRRRRRRRGNSSLTLPVLRMVDTLIDYRQLRFSAKLRGEAAQWLPDVSDMDKVVAEAGYRSDSQRWLEHYIVACFYALPLQEDRTQEPAHLAYAEAAVRFLYRAQECGDDAEFVTSKRYWLLAGDPDLAGLRLYETFRAFETRIYLHPQPVTADPAKYELFHYMRLGLAQGAEVMESLWAERLHVHADKLSARELEHWFRLERRAWEIMVRLGRFHPQWQTRSAGLEALRRLGRYAEADAPPIPYPEKIRDYYNVGVGGSTQSEKRIEGMQGLFAFLASQLGPAAAIDVESDPQEGLTRFGEAESPSESPTPPQADQLAMSGFEAPILTKVRAWIWHAEFCSRQVPGATYPMTDQELHALCQRMAAVWAALRQRATTPARRGNDPLIRAVARVPLPKTPADAPLDDPSHALKIVDIAGLEHAKGAKGNG